MRSMSLATSAVLLGAVGAAFPQIVALLTLASEDFGVFSALYLGAAMGGSFLLSTVQEAWARHGHAASRELYLGTAALVAATFGVVTAAVAMLVGIGSLVALIAATGIAASSLWGSAHYLLASQAEWRRMLLGDGSGLAAASAVLVAGFLAGLDHLACVLAAWAAYGTVATLVTRTLAAPSPRAVREWFSMHRKEIGVLLPDSLLLDLGSIGTPLLMLPFMTAGPFGIYRAISNVAFPVRLIIATVRPLLGRLPLTRARSLSTAAALAVAGAAIGAAAAVCVVLVALYLPFLGVVAELRPYAVHAGVFVASTTFNTIVYIVCRIWASRRTLLRGRVLQTVVMVAAPLIGFALGGVDGAITGFVSGAVAICAIWFGVLRTMPATPPAR